MDLSELKAICEKASATSTKNSQSAADSASEAKAWRDFCLLTLQWACTTSKVAENQALPMNDCSTSGTQEEHLQGCISLPIFRPPPGLEDLGPGPLPQCTPESFLATENGFARPDSHADSEAVDTIYSSDATPKHVDADATPKHNDMLSKKPSVDCEEGETLRDHLQELQDEDPALVIIVRKISKLGFQSPDLLRNYFEEYGEVGKILVAHSFVKPSNRRVKPRVRPAGLGFVVMTSRADADAVLCMGENQTIAGVPVQVLPYAQPEKPT
jgi:hypothetical protein